MIALTPIAYVRNARVEIEDDYWGEVTSTIVMEGSLGEESIRGLEAFSHAEIVFHFHRVDPAKIVTDARHPRNNPAFPRVGIFAQRGKNRPNGIGIATARILGREGGVLFVRDLDAIDGTPILDIKPVLREFEPIGELRQPTWATELMQDYWKAR